jgi:hypothetical protein
VASASAAPAPSQAPAPTPATVAESVADPFNYGSEDERRRAVRRLGNSVAILIADAATKNEPRRGFVVDRSTYGIRLAVDEPAALDSILSICRADAACKFWVKVSVMHCKRTDVGWELGCQFVQNVPYTVLLQFG